MLKAPPPPLLPVERNVTLFIRGSCTCNLKSPQRAARLPFPAVAGAFYLRLVGRPLDVYQYLEPLYNDYRKVGWKG